MRPNSPEHVKREKIARKKVKKFGRSVAPRRLHPADRAKCLLWVENGHSPLAAEPTAAPLLMLRTAPTLQRVGKVVSCGEPALRHSKLQTDPFFGLAPYHVALTVIGASIILAYWVPRFFSGREPAASALLILAGAIAISIVPGMPEAIDPRSGPRLWEYASELAVIVALFGTGLRIDNLTNYSRWRPTIRLLLVAMPLTIIAVALLGFFLAGMTLAGAVLLGAVLAPTDPVLAGDVQIGKPTEGGEHPVRFALTTEAGLNDGLAFPFVSLGLILAERFTIGSLATEWLPRDVIYRIAVGALSGAFFGWLLGKFLFSLPRGNPLADTASGVLALAGVLLSYGATELIEGYGFIAAFVSGLTLRRAEANHDFHGRLHNFSESIEHALTAILLILIGGALPLLWSELDWRHAAVAFALILIVRPLAG